eukprot:2791265-Rhodomonas_salina.3
MRAGCSGANRATRTDNESLQGQVEVQLAREYLAPGQERDLEAGARRWQQTGSGLCLVLRPAWSHWVVFAGNVRKTGWLGWGGRCASPGITLTKS